MARMPGVTWRPVPNCTKGGQDAVYGVVLHVMAGTLDGSDSWFRNPAAQASAHFGVGKDGRIFQWVDTADRAWAQAGGNHTWLSIEHEGQGGDSLTSKQLAATASIVAWMHKTHGVALQTTDSTTGRGIGWHGMGGSAWGGHTACPGTPIKNQRAAIIKAAGGTTPPAKPPAPKPAYEPYPGASFFMNGSRPALGKSSPIFTAMGKRLVAVGCSRYAVGPGPKLGQADVDSYEAFQRKQGYSGAAAKWPPGRTTWDALHVPNV